MALYQVWYNLLHEGLVMGTRPIRRENPPCGNLVIIMAHKSKCSRRKQRQGFFRMIKQLAVFLHWFAGFALILLEIWEIIKNWGNGCFRGLYFIPHYPEIGYKKLRLAEFTLNIIPILSQYRIKRATCTLTEYSPGKADYAETLL